MIVSRGAMESNGAETLSRGGTLGKVDTVNAGIGVTEVENNRNVGGGSTLSLPYSSRTILTNSSTRSAAFGIRQILPEEEGGVLLFCSSFFIDLFFVLYFRGKYSLSEREYLWDHRIKGSINLQKISKS